MQSSLTAALESDSEQQLESERNAYSHLPSPIYLDDREGTVSIGGRTITHLRFADDIDGVAGEEEELSKLVERLDKASTTYGIEISAEENKLMTNNTSGINKEIKVNGQRAGSDKLQ